MKPKTQNQAVGVSMTTKVKQLKKINKIRKMDTGENQTKFILERINATDKYFANLHLSVLGLLHQESQIRDKQDSIAKIFASYGQAEAFNLTLAEALESLAKGTTLLADLKDVEVKRMSKKVASELKEYEDVCKRTRDNIREAVAERDKSRNKKVGKKASYWAISRNWFFEL